ncbi:MAG: acyl-CoA dehydrogenase family protein [Chromatocurvus sp.]
MSQPDNYGFGEDAALLKTSAAKFFARHLPVDRLHALVAGSHDPDRRPEAPWPEALWQQMVDLGWTSLAVPESAGGLGMPCVAVAGLVEELGRAAFPCPLLGTLAASYVLAECGERAHAALGEIVDGTAAALATTDATGAWDPAATGVSYEGDVLSGCAYFVQDVRKVQRLLVRAAGAEGLRLFWVAVASDGLEVQSDAIVDLTRDQGRVTFAGVPAQRLGDAGEAALDRAMPALWTLLAADIAGAAEWLLQTSVEYARSRQQFEHPLGFFQAVKHPLVDVMSSIDATRSLLYSAACAIDHEPGRARQLAHMAQASACVTAACSAGRAVQTHGGIGFTWECYVHLYFKRQKHSEVLWGDAAWHRARLAEILLGDAAAAGRSAQGAEAAA